MKYNDNGISLPLEKIKDTIDTGNYDFVLAYGMSEVYLGAGTDIPFPKNEIMEIRFFSEEEELHIFRSEREWKAVRVGDNSNDDNNDNDNNGDDNNDGKNIKDIRIRKYKLAKRFQNLGNALNVKDYLEDDEDGQVYVKQTRLCGIV